MRTARVAVLTALLTAGALAVAPAEVGAAPPPAPTRAAVAYQNLQLPAGHATVYSDGLAEVFRDSAKGAPAGVEFQWVPLVASDGATTGTRVLPSKGQIVADLAHGPAATFRPGEVVVVYSDAVQAPTRFSAPARSGTAAPHYTNQPALNTTLATLGVDHAQQLFTGPADLAAQRATAERAVGRPLLNFANAFVLHLATASVPVAVSTLRESADVTYASPNWTVTPTNTPPTDVPAAAVRDAQARAQAQPANADGVPTNFALTSSAQSLLNRPGVDAVPAYAALAERYHQMPGQGETITNVSLGTVDDASAAADPNDPCNFYATAYGPTTEVINGQRYLDWPSMPLIPTYTSTGGVLNPAGESCGDDPSLTEVGLDFSMMAPLPHDVQRPDALGSGLTDLLGIAPGAQYRLIVPSTPGGAVSDVDAAFLAAAQQTPRPSVITASLGFGFDQFGFSARYLEDDPITEAILSTIVHSYHIVVCVSGGDGLRSFTNAPVPPSGGSVATGVTPAGGTPTDVNDVGFSSAPSSDFDSGAIAVGSTTLDDIFSAPPQDPRNAALVAQHAFPETRYNGFRSFASAYGKRMNLSAPGDNVLSFAHAMGQDAKSVQVVNEGGTSASAPEVAAAAAVVLQAARLTGNKSLAGSPLAVRNFLAQTGSDVAAVPQSDVDLNVGPQVDVGNAVATLLGRAGYHPAAAGPRVAVEQRQQASALGGTITTATDAANVSLTGRLLNAWISISPDWVGLPASGVTYRLAATTGPKSTLSRTAWARLQPAAILAAAGLPLASAEPRTVELAYRASANGHVLANVPVTLTLGPTDGTSPSALAPVVPAVSSASTIPVQYDISQISNPVDPTLVVSEPGRVDPVTGQFFRPAYSVPLRASSGVIQVPVSALQGAGIYGVGIQSAPGGPSSTNYTAFAFTRVGPVSAAQPAAPRFSYQGSTPSHFVEVPYHAPFQMQYDVRSVPGATGAAVEVSAAGPTSFNNNNPFNNPNGSERDNNGSDFGSVAFAPLPATHGTATLNSASLGMYPAMNHVVRVLALRGGAVVGESSGVSTAIMDGVRPADGGFITNGYSINSHGTDGFLTSDQATASGQILGSVETFDQATNAITSTVTSTSHVYGTLMGGCPGAFHGDVGLYDDSTPSADTFRVLNPVATGTQSGTWTPAPADVADGLLCPAPNQTTDDTAVLAGLGGPGATYRVFTSNVGQNTFSPDHSLAPAISPMGFPIAGGIAQNTTTGSALVGVADLTNLDGPGRLVSVNLGDGSVTSTPTVTTGFVEGVAVDEKTNTAVVGSLNPELGIYNLSDGTSIHVTPGGATYQHPAVDSVHGRIAVQEVAGPDFLGQTSNNNALSSVLTLDEQGKVISRIERFNFFNVFLLDMGTYLQLNPNTGNGYVLGPGGSELAPFRY